MPPLAGVKSSGSVDVKEMLTDLTQRRSVMITVDVSSVEN